MKFDILIVGVGGQGIILASRLLATAAINAGFFVRTSETLGMAQRGGCVVSHVRIGSEKVSPIIPFGMADLIIGYEPIEVARNITRLSPTGRCIINTKDINPFTEQQNDDSLRLNGILEQIKRYFPNSIFVNGHETMEKLNCTNMLNVYLLGITASYGLFPFSNEILIESIHQVIPSSFIDSNTKIINMGLSYNVS